MAQRITFYIDGFRSNLFACKARTSTTADGGTFDGEGGGNDKEKDNNFFGKTF